MFQIRSDVRESDQCLSNHPLEENFVLSGKFIVIGNSYFYAILNIGHIESNYCKIDNITKKKQMKKKKNNSRPVELKCLTSLSALLAK